MAASHGRAVAPEQHGVVTSRGHLLARQLLFHRGQAALSAPIAAACHCRAVAPEQHGVVNSRGNLLVRQLFSQRGQAYSVSAR